MSSDNHIMSRAVAIWYRHYGADWDDYASSVLCDAAIELYNGGCRSADEMVATLIERFVGIESMRINAPSSDSVH